MERYELVEGTSAKFWEVGITDTTLTVRFGRIGTNGQSKDKEFDTLAAAEKEKAKLIKEKTGKGYAAAGTSPDPVVAAKPAKPKSEPKPEPVAVVAAVAEGDIAVLERAPLKAEAPPRQPVVDDQPDPTIDDLLVHAMPTRTDPGGKLDAAAGWKAAHDNIEALLPGTRQVDSKLSAWFRMYLGEDGPKTSSKSGAIGWLKSKFGGGSSPQLTLAEAAEWMFAIRRSGSLRDVDEVERALVWRRRNAALSGFFEWLGVTHGGAMLAALASLPRPAGEDRRHYYVPLAWSDEVPRAMRPVMVRLPDDEYEVALDALLAAADAPDADWDRKVSYAFILGDDRPEPHRLQALPLLQAAADDGQDVRRHARFKPLRYFSQPSASAQWRKIEKATSGYSQYPDELLNRIMATIVATARRYDEPALPVLECLFQDCFDDDRIRLIGVMFALNEPGTMQALVPILNDKAVRQAIDQAMQAYPGRTFRQLMSVTPAARNEPVIKSRIAEVVRSTDEATLRTWLGGDERGLDQLEKVQSRLDIALADNASLPSVLTDPPWRKKARKRDDIVLDLSPLPTPFAYDSPTRHGRVFYRSGGNAPPLTAVDEVLPIIASSEARAFPAWYKIPLAENVPQAGDSEADILAWLQARVQVVYRARNWALNSSDYGKLFAVIEKQPEPLMMALWESAGPALSHYSCDAIFDVMLRKLGERAMVGVDRQLDAEPVKVLEFALTLDAAEVAPHAARALVKLKTARAFAMTWLRRYRSTAITRLIPDAVGKIGAQRDAAEIALRWLVANTDDGRAAIEDIAKAYTAQNGQAAEAVAQVLDRDPLAQVPARIGKLPAWFTPAALARPELKSGGALSDDAVVALAEMLMFSTPEAVYGGIDVVKQAVTRESAAAFAWDLFSAWLAEGAPGKEGWALRAVGWLGDDECARQLTRLIRKWPGESAHQRAVSGLDVLVDIGSDVALMNLNGIAEKLKFKGLQEKAREKIAAIAETRDLSPEELSDRLAPDLDLDERGGLDIVFGERQFRAGFDEFLKPWVKDASGQRLKDLPKPNKSDDPTLSKDATARWSALKKDARAVASLQITRLENMLSTSRRTGPEVFWTFFASHPLIRHLSQRLVWGVYADNDANTAPTTIFRVAEDLLLTDAEDNSLDLDFSAEAPGRIGLVHPLHLPQGGLDAWGALFGDYEISQPFPQLGRETFEITEEEGKSHEIKRFNGIEVETGYVRGMSGRGWQLGSPQDGGVVWWLERVVTFPDGASKTVNLSFEEGLFTGAAEYENKTQKLGILSLEGPYSRNVQHDRLFGQLDRVTISEMLRGPSLIAETRMK